MRKSESAQPKVPRYDPVAEARAVAVARAPRPQPDAVRAPRAPAADLRQPRPDAAVTLPDLGALLHALRDGQAIRVEIAGVEISVCSRDHLVAMKRARSNPIDIADLERLTDAQG
jgi:hypothetical protein